MFRQFAQGVFCYFSNLKITNGGGFVTEFLNFAVKAIKRSAEMSSNIHLLTYK